MKSLYEITTSYQQLADLLLEQGGEMTPEQESRLMITEKELSIKAENYVKVIKTFDAENIAIDEEIKRLQGLKKSRVTAKKRLVNALDNALQMFGYNSLKVGLFNLSYRKSESVKITVSAEKLPKNCQTIEIKPISKVELKQKLKAGEEISGVELIINQNLQIK
jgi:hypothetical protein